MQALRTAPADPTKLPPWTSHDTHLFHPVRTFHRDDRGIWRARVDGGRVWLGGRARGALTPGELASADPPAIFQDVAFSRGALQGRPVRGLQLFDERQKRTATVHWLRLPDGFDPDLPHREWWDCGAYTAAGFYSIWPDEVQIPNRPTVWLGFSNRRLVTLNRSGWKSGVDVRPNGGGALYGFVLTPYGFVVPAPSHSFVLDYLANGDLEAAYRRAWPKEGSRVRHQTARRRAQERLQDPTTYALFLEEMAAALKRAEGGVARFIVEGYRTAIERSLASDQPWKAVEALEKLQGIAERTAQGVEELRGRSLEPGARTTTTPAREMSRVELETIEAMAPDTPIFDSPN